MSIRPLAATALCAVACAPSVSASPLTLRYSVSDLGDGTYRYTFKLEMDNHDGTWEPGQGFGWVVFGDEKNQRSALEDFVPDGPPLALGLWEGISKTAGFNNGPTLGDGRVVWVPDYYGETIAWSGVSSARLFPGELRWSCLFSDKTMTTARHRPPVLFEVAAEVCAADINGDGFVSGDDFDVYMWLFQAGDARADFNSDGFVSGDDFDGFARAFENGCS